MIGQDRAKNAEHGEHVHVEERRQLVVGDMLDRSHARSFDPRSEDARVYASKLRHDVCHAKSGDVVRGPEISRYRKGGGAPFVQKPDDSVKPLPVDVR